MPRRILPRWLALFVQPHIAIQDARNVTLVIVKQFLCGKPGIDFHAQLLGLAAQPFAQLAQADDVVALVAHHGRQQGFGQAPGLVFG